MGNWFENMEPMDIQEERAKTKAAEEKLGEAEKKLQEAQIESMKSVVQLVKELAGDKTLAAQKLMDNCHMTKEEAEAFVEKIGKTYERVGLGSRYFRAFYVGDG